MIKQFLDTRNSLLLLLAVVMGYAIPPAMVVVRIAGYQIPQPDIEADYLIGMAWAVALGVSILIWPVPDKDKPTLALLWAAKTAITLGFMLVYEWNYGLDSFWYFSESLRGDVLPFQGTGWGRGTDNVIAITWLHSAIFADSYHAMKVTFAMVGLFGIYLLYRGCVQVMGREDRRLLLILGLFPSILFWSSTLGKEPVQLLGMGLYFYGVLGWWRTQRISFTVPVALGIALSTFMRVWYGIIMIVPLLVFALRGIRGTGKRLLFFGVGSMAMVWGINQFAVQLRVAALDDIAERADVIASGFQEGVAEENQVTFTSIESMVAFAPTGAFTALFRPFPGEVMNPFGLLAGLESVLVLSLMLLAMFRAGRKILEPHVQWAIVLILVWSAFHAFVSYYNFGAAVRFRLPILPVLVCVALYLSRKRHEGSEFSLVRRPV